jgi:hypothetical protein
MVGVGWLLDEMSGSHIECFHAVFKACTAGKNDYSSEGVIGDEALDESKSTLDAHVWNETQINHCDMEVFGFSESYCARLVAGGSNFSLKSGGAQGSREAKR